MNPGRIAAIVIGVLLAVPALVLLVGGGALTIGYATERADDGYFDTTLERLSTPTAAITTGEVDLRANPGPPDELLEFVDFSVRIRATGLDEGSELFIGIGPEADVEAYLSGVARDEIRDVEEDGDVEYRSIPGTGAQTEKPCRHHRDVQAGPVRAKQVGPGGEKSRHVLWG